jgi:hypothetical protein
MRFDPLGDVMLYDISHPHDLRVTLGKPSISTAEIDQFLEDSGSDPEVKRQLLADVEVQGYPDQSSSRNP